MTDDFGRLVAVVGVQIWFPSTHPRRVESRGGAELRDRPQRMEIKDSETTRSHLDRVRIQQHTVAAHSERRSDTQSGWQAVYLYVLQFHGLFLTLCCAISPDIRICSSLSPVSVTMSGVVVTQNQQPRFAFYSIEELLKKSSSKTSVEHSPEHEVLDFSGPKKGLHFRQASTIFLLNFYSL